MKLTKKSLNSLILETISDIKLKNREIFNPSLKQSASKREQFINETIKRTISILTEAEEQSDEVENVELNNAEEDTSSSSSSPNAYSDFLEDLLGADHNGTAGWTLKEAKTKMKEVIARLPDQLKTSAFNGADLLDQIKFGKEPSFKAQKLKPSQLQVYMDQSIDGYFTRGTSYAPDIIQGGYTADSLWFSKEGYIIDGHHRCASIVALNPDCLVTGTVMDANIELCLKLLNLLLELQAGGRALSKGGNETKSIFAPQNKITPKAVLAEWEGFVGRVNGSEFPPSKKSWRIKAASDQQSQWNPWDTPDEDESEGQADAGSAIEQWCKDITGQDITRLEEVDIETAPAATSFMKLSEVQAQYGNNPEALALLIANNLKHWPGPEPKFGKRTEMPQLDDQAGNPTGKPKDLQPKLAGTESGSLDWNKPITETIDRWNKLAGL